MIPVTFGLLNEYGETFGLDDINKAYLVDVEGLNYEKDNTYSSIGVNFIRTSSKDVQKKITGNVVFAKSNIYQKENDFKTFIRKSKALVFWAKTPITTKYIDVDVTAYTLQHIGMNALGCPIVMLAKGMWYSSVQKSIVDTSDDNEVRYSYRLPAMFNDHSEGRVDIDNDGSEEAAFTLELYGDIVDPVVSLYVDDVEVKRLAITATVDEGEKIIYSSRDGNLYCYFGTDEQIAEFKRTGIPTGLTNLALSFSLDNTNFFKLPVGFSQLRFSAENPLTNPIVIETYKYYRAV